LTAIARLPVPVSTSALIARVMVCDDSMVIRGAITRILDADPEIRVVAKVANGRAAVEEIRRTPVDVVVLDIEMPVMDGMAALPLLLEADPGVRVIMASTLTTRGADIAMRALRLGAADYVPKPSTVGTQSDDGFRRELVLKVKGLARQRRPVVQPGRPRAVFTLRPAPPIVARLLAIGSSTGGPQALFTLVQGLGKGLGVPVVITQQCRRPSPRSWPSISAAWASCIAPKRRTERRSSPVASIWHLATAICWWKVVGPA
jgi:two-component system chemotaxis response regulator CheB